MCLVQCTHLHLLDQPGEPSEQLPRLQDVYEEEDTCVYEEEDTCAFRAASSSEVSVKRDLLVSKETY